MPANFIRISLFLVTLTVFIGSLRADTIKLIDGGILSGKILNDPKSEVITIQTSEGIEIAVARTQCKDVRVNGERELAYLKLVAGKEDTAEAHREIVKECGANSQKDLSEAHRERVVELDPSDSASWTALGYLKDRGTWVKREILTTSRGLVRRYKEAGYCTPHARAIAEADDRINTAKYDVKQAIDRHYRNLSQTGNRGIEAKTFFRNLNDVLAIEFILDRTKDDLAKGKNVDFWMALLAQMPGTSACGALIDLAMNSNNSRIEDECLTLLTRTPDSTEIAYSAFLGYLGNKQLELTDRAARHLQSLGDPRAVETLIKAMYSTVTITTANQNPISPQGGMNFGPKTSSSKHKHPHEAVISALTALTGESYGRDQDKWRIWYASTNADTNLDLRRNP
jgi:hypothetical protein